MRRLGLDERLRLLGARRDVADLLGAADLFVLSSVREGLPVTLLEAMHAGCPVVASDVGGVREAVVEGETGRLVPPGDPARLAEALEGLLVDRAGAARMGGAARRRWAERFTATEMVSRTESLYREAWLGASART